MDSSGQPETNGIAARLLKAPVHAYRWTLKPLIGLECRHLPTCSQYALDAIDRNGAWKGFWLMVARLSRCHPWGTSGYDAAPDLSGVREPLWRAYRYGDWNGRHIAHHVGCKCDKV
jgi:uncharacterized protein